MDSTASLVQTLHRINRQKADLLGQLQRGPKTVAHSQGQLKHVTDYFQATRERLKRAKMDADAKQLQLKEREQKIYVWQGKLNAAKENREFQAIKDQIAADTQANAVLSDEILEILESIDVIGQELKQAEAAVAAKSSDLEKVQQQVAGRKTVLESELCRVQEQLVQAESLLDGDLKRDYQRLVATKAEDAMAELDGNCCSGCYKSLTPSLLDKLLMRQAIICPNCGRLVYKNQD
ncbi:MAG TPA: phospholipase [Planctomycetaceae bacterium]|nr:phospholipase [Planctomycetaceae bacterium]